VGGGGGINMVVDVTSGLVGRCRADARRRMDESTDFCGLQRIPADFRSDVSRGGIACWSRARGALACILTHLSWGVIGGVHRDLGVLITCG
jgi:hypothetical protein